MSMRQNPSDLYSRLCHIYLYYFSHFLNKCRNIWQFWNLMFVLTHKKINLYNYFYLNIIIWLRCKILIKKGQQTEISYNGSRLYIYYLYERNTWLSSIMTYQKSFNFLEWKIELLCGLNKLIFFIAHYFN